MICNKVFLNPGHKIGLDSGAVNPISGLQEAQVCYDICEKVKYYLENVGIEVYMLQSNSLYGEDADENNPPVCQTSNNWGADVVISVHCNAFNTVAKGTETLIYNYGFHEPRKLAECIQSQIVNSLNTVDRGIKERPELLVLRATDCPAVLVELAFIDNESDVKLLEEKQDVFARAIARGVTDFQNL